MSDLTFGAPDLSEVSGEEPTSHLRWNNDILEQKWERRVYSPRPSISHDWRTVPVTGDTQSPAENLLALSEDQIAAVLHLVESRLCIIWAQVGAREAFANELRVLEPVSEDEAELCSACDMPFEDGDMVYWNSDDTGHLHAGCCGPGRESYVNADGEPLKDGELIPAPFVWRAGR
ncbi:hypothetical protein [Pararhizobium sp. DWP3-4]|uniref:hypothetical protein n=1 Tax=Pararhizobium sp. DWP3-4 TaxID=2804565 RepID=UPI003CF26B73